MAFAKDYREEITLAYYCFSLALTIAAFIFGTIYLRHRDRRDQQRREWRQFAERIYSDYSKLKDKDVPRKISKVRDTFQDIPIKSSITGLDVLRYMLADANYERSKTSQLESLRADLQSIFSLFNVCSSLLFLGKVPKNIKEELRDVVIELGNPAWPFFIGKRRKIILKCLKHFGSCRPKRETEKRVDAKLEETIPYVKSCLRFGRTENLSTSYPGYEVENLLDGLQLDFEQLCYGPTAGPYARCGNGGGRDYSQCSNFNVHCLLEDDPLTHLQTILQEPRYKKDFEGKLQRHPVPLVFDTKLSDNDGQEPVLVKVLHEVRVYIHLCLTNQLAEHNQVEQIKENMTRLCNVKEEVTRVMPTEANVKYFCDRFISDLQSLKRSRYHCNNQNFCEKLEQLWKNLQEIQIIRESSEENLPSIARNHEDEDIPVQFEGEENQLQYESMV